MWMLLGLLVVLVLGALWWTSTQTQTPSSGGCSACAKRKQVAFDE